MATLSRPLRLGTRGSPLALAQAEMVAAALRDAHGWGADAIEIVTVRTTGDRIQDRPLAEIGGKALWTKELDQQLLGDAIDIAVHSMKDVETVRPDALRIVAMLPRADVRDRLVGADAIDALPGDARVGTASPRRAAQVRHRRPDLAIVPFRGNVDTRLKRLAAGEAEATLLAAAGLSRLARDDVGVALDTDVMLPAPAQGAIGIEARREDAGTRVLLAAIDHRVTHMCVATERALLAALGADCRSPVAALAELEGSTMRLRAELLSEDGSLRVADETEVAAAGAAAAFADRLLASAPEALARLFAAR